MATLSTGRFLFIGDEGERVNGSASTLPHLSASNTITALTAMMLTNFNIEFLKVQPAIVDFISWSLSALLWGNILALLLLEAPSAQPQAQVDIPNEVWGQYPLILLGCVLVGWLARYWVANEREWREFTTKQVNDKEAALLGTLQLIQTNNEKLHKILLDGQAEQLRLQREGLKEAFDEALERIMDAQAATGQKTRGRSNGPA